VLKTEIIKINSRNPDISKIKKVSKIIRKGGVVIFPTETVYGIGADALNQDAVKKIFKIKKRPYSSPLIVHIAEFETLHLITKNIPEVLYLLAEKFWPGPLTVILKKKKIVPDIVTASLDTVGVRIPDNKIALSLIKEAKTPIAAPSANIFSYVSATSFQDVIEEFNGKVDIIIDGGDTKFGLESTVLDLTENPAKILRFGSIPKEKLEKYLKLEIPQKIENYKGKSPGLKKIHYSPNAFLILVRDSSPEKIFELMKKYKNKKIGILTYKENIEKYKNFDFKIIGSKKNYRECAKNLYKILREFDREKYEIIIAEGIEEKYLGTTIMDRLKKAAKIIY
jgi:L-threonylcarbamoyladenylate synthase